LDKVAAVKNFRNRLANNGVSIGSWMQLADSDVAEILGQAGYDWVAIDMEHGLISHDRLPDLFRALELGGTMPFVRLPEATQIQCKRALDAGACGVVAPMISTADQVSDLADACRWPPAGKRGVAFSRANMFGKHFGAYFEFAQAPFLAVMAETREAVENMAEIASDDRVDAVLIGPYDLSASLGITGDFEAVEFKEAVDEIVARAKEARKPVGMHVVDPDPSALKLRVDQGFRFLAYTLDTVALRSALENPLRNSLKEIETGK
jgi:2-dehydro-3-deoxyglucarate aldolase